jgi:hypothetical protein
MRSIGPRDQKRARKAASADNTQSAQARSTARSRAADLRRAGRSIAVRAGDRHRGWRACRHRAPGQHRNDPRAKPSASASEPAAADVCLHPVSDRGALLRLCRLCGVQFPVALFDATRPFVPGNDDTDVVWTSPLACGRYFLLRLAGCQGKDLIAEGRRSAPAGSRLSGRAARTPRWPCRTRRFHCSG